MTVQQRCWLVDGFQKSPPNVTGVWSKILKGLQIVTLLLPLPITTNIKHKGYEFILSCCSPNSHNVHSWPSCLGDSNFWSAGLSKSLGCYKTPSIAKIWWRSWQVSESGALVGWHWQWKTGILGDKPILVPFCEPQMSHGADLDRTQTSAMIGSRNNCLSKVSADCKTGNCVLYWDRWRMSGWFEIYTAL